jgi:hypothetical protein
VNIDASACYISIGWRSRLLGYGHGAGGGALVGSTVGYPWLEALVGGVGGAVVGHEFGKN